MSDLDWNWKYLTKEPEDLILRRQIKWTPIFFCWMFSGTSVGNPSSLWVGQMVSRGALFSWWTWTYDLVSQKTKRINNSILISQRDPLFLPLSPLEVEVVERGAREGGIFPLCREGGARMTGSRLRPRKWLVGDPVRVKSCPRGGPDQRTRRSVTCPGLAMCLASGRQRMPAGKISSLASPLVHPLVSSRTWVA